MLKCVMTGGPCAGKSQIMEDLVKNLEYHGYKVFVLPEVATKYILSGIKPSKEFPMMEFQRFVLRGQLNNEMLYDQVAGYFPADKVVMLYDRGIMDGQAYVGKENYQSLLSSQGLTLQDVYARYDAVFHLVTAANGAPEHYQWNDPASLEEGNNAARSESPEEAIEVDNLTLDSWRGHPQLHIIDNSTDFQGKIDRVLREVYHLLGISQ